MPQRNIKKLKEERRKKEKEGFVDDGRLRIPRPRGFTLALQSLNPNDPQKTKKTLNYLKQLIVEQWTMDNNELHGKLYTIKDLSIYLNLPISITMKIMNNCLVRVSNLFGGNNGERMGEVARAQIFRLLFCGSESHSLIAKQTNILMASQGDGYKPFISGEVNRSLANMIQSNRAMADLVKLMMPSNTGQLTINNNLNQTAKYVNTEQAVNLIRENTKSMIEDTSLLPILEGVPNISARTQDLSKIGIKNANLLPAPKEPRPNKEKKYEHGNRDEIIDIGEDLDDFKA